VLSGRLEVANQAHVDETAVEEPNAPERREQIMLRAAIEKVGSNRLQNITDEEARLINNCYHLLARRLNPSMKDERLLRILGAAVQVLERRRAGGANR